MKGVKLKFRFKKECEDCGKLFGFNGGKQRFCGSRLHKTGCSYKKYLGNNAMWTKNNRDSVKAFIKSEVKKEVERYIKLLRIR